MVAKCCARMAERWSLGSGLDFELKGISEWFFHRSNVDFQPTIDLRPGDSPAVAKYDDN